VSWKIFLRIVFENIAVLASLTGWSKEEIIMMRLSEISLWAQILSEQDRSRAEMQGIIFANKIGELFPKR